jgi:hypothetical protein
MLEKCGDDEVGVLWPCKLRVVEQVLVAWLWDHPSTLCSSEWNASNLGRGIWQGDGVWVVEYEIHVVTWAWLSQPLWCSKVEVGCPAHCASAVDLALLRVRQSDCCSVLLPLPYHLPYWTTQNSKNM